jgi:hypothetical protein
MCLRAFGWNAAEKRIGVALGCDLWRGQAWRRGYGLCSAGEQVRAEGAEARRRRRSRSGMCMPTVSISMAKPASAKNETVALSTWMTSRPLRPRMTPATISPTTTGTNARRLAASKGPARPAATISARSPRLTRRAYAQQTRQRQDSIPPVMRDAPLARPSRFPGSQGPVGLELFDPSRGILLRPAAGGSPARRFCLGGVPGALPRCEQSAPLP